MRLFPIVIGSIVAGASVLMAAAPGASPQAESGGDAAARTSYAIGHTVGARTLEGLSNDGMGVDVDLIAKGFADALTGLEPLVDRSAMRGIRAAVHQEMEARRVTRLLADCPDFKGLCDSNAARGRKFRELFAKQPGVVALPSGAQYVVVQAGKGPSPGQNDMVLVKVRAQLLNREVLNAGDTPFELRVRDTIPGGVEILQLMSAGAKWQVVLPPELAYDTGGRFPDIGPNETMVLTVELLQITSAEGGRQ